MDECALPHPKAMHFLKKIMYDPDLSQYDDSLFHRWPSSTNEQRKDDGQHNG